MKPERVPLIGAAVTAILATSTLLGACGLTGAKTTPSTPTSSAVPKNELERITAHNIRDQLKIGPVEIICQNDLPIKVGASEKCNMVHDGQRSAIKLIVTKIDGPDNATWDWELVRPEPQ